MTQTIDLYAERRQDWVARVQGLVDQAVAWCGAQGWAVERTEKTVNERLLGSYRVPELAVETGQGEFVLDPVALHIAGGNGRVDLRAYPTFSRVKLIGTEAGGWIIMTDSNVPLREPWNEQTFVELIGQLLGRA